VRYIATLSVHHENASIPIRIFATIVPRGMSMNNLGSTKHPNTPLAHFCFSGKGGGERRVSPPPNCDFKQSFHLEISECFSRGFASSENTVRGDIQPPVPSLLLP
jgi:hypothetical protein